jgi:hypothetical protein
MSPTFRCQNCGLEKTANYRLPLQKYCADEKCQRVRRRAYQKSRRQADAHYRQKQLDCQAAWRTKRSLADYQRAYRQTHPDYVRRNRQQQRQRNRKRRVQKLPQASVLIVKMNSCSSIESGIYLLTPCSVKPAAEVIVKMNSCMVELSVFQQPVSSAARHVNDCK